MTDNTKCGGSPVVSESCTSTSSCACTWKYTDFSTCSAGCGAGTRARTITACSATSSTGSMITCPSSQCGAATTSQTCTGTSTCTTSCTATPCNGDRTPSGQAKVTFAVGSNGALTGTVSFDQPKYGDLRGFFLEFPTSCKIDASKCTITGKDVTAFERNVVAISSQKSANLQGCPAKSYDLAVALGSEGQSKNDIRSTSFILSCTGVTLTVGDVAGATVGVRVTSVGTCLASRGDSVKLACVLPNSAAYGRRL